jgi:hypothetical protein
LDLAKKSRSLGRRDDLGMTIKALFPQPVQAAPNRAQKQKGFSRWPFQF